MAIGMVSISGSALAQTATAGDEINVLNEVIVTAQKREEKLQDVPIAITVVGAQQLADQHVYTVADLSRTTPALEMVQAFGGPGGGGQIRGIGTTAFTRSAEGAVGIVLDGVPQGNVNVSNIFDMQRVEVLRGPQGTLFGLTSSAGVINMVTVAPDPTKFETKLHVDYSDKGTAGSKFGQQTFKGVVNVPFTDDSALRLSVTGDRTSGVQDNTFTRKDNVANDYSVRARYRLKGADDFEMNLIADYAKRTQNYSDPQFTYVSANPALTAALATCGITPSFANASRCSTQSTISQSRNYGFAAQFDMGLGNQTLTSITGYRKNDVGPNNVDIMGLSVNVDPSHTQITSTGVLNDGRQISQEFRIVSPDHQRFEYVAGLFYSDYEANTGYATGGAFRVALRIPVPFPPFILAINVPDDATKTETSNKSYAAFGQSTYHINDELGLITGLRFTRQKISDSASNTVATELSKSNISGKLGLQYKFNPDLTGYVTAVRGYKGPQVQSASQGSPATIIDAEIPTAYEIGIKGTSLNGRFGYEANVFHTKVKNYQGQRCQINPVGVLDCTPQSIPSVITKGFEVDLIARPIDQLSLSGGFIYNIAKYPSGWTGYNPDNLNGGTTSLSDEQIVGVPKTKLNFAADYAVPMGAVEGFIGVDTVYKSSMRLGPSGDSRFVYPAHWNTGARVGIRSQDGNFAVTLFGRNLGNDHEPITLFGGPSFTAPGNDPTRPNGYVNGISGWITAASLRQVGISLDAKF